MQNQFQTLSQETPAPLSSLSFCTEEQQDMENAHIRAKVEDYLDHVCQPLIESVPYSRRLELRCEITQHLYALMQAYQEMGDPPLTAAEKALEKFGQPEVVARQWKPLLTAKTSRVSFRRWFGRQWQGIASTLAVCSLMGVWFAASRPVSVTAGQTASQQTLAQQLPSQIVQAPDNFTHRSVMNTECSSCHVSTMNSAMMKADRAAREADLTTRLANSVRVDSVR